MPRRRRNDDWIWPVAQLVGLFVALGFIYPSFRQMVGGIGSLCVVPLVVAVVVVLGLGTCKLLARRGTAQTLSFKVSAPSATVAASDANQAERPSTIDLVQQLRSIDWFQFEQMVALVYRKQGYAVSRRGGANPDGGIDLVIERDGTRTAVQCKHWKTWNVGVKAVREFLGALTDAGIQRGLFITLGNPTRDAAQLADKHSIQVVNETDLARMLEATDARFDPAALEILLDTRKLCPKCERKMVLRTARNGSGNKFWGCSGFPRCRSTMPA
jgi:restriction system protein